MEFRISFICKTHSFAFVKSEDEQLKIWITFPQFCLNKFFLNIRIKDPSMLAPP